MDPNPDYIPCVDPVGYGWDSKLGWYKRDLGKWIPNPAYEAAEPIDVSVPGCSILEVPESMSDTFGILMSWHRKLREEVGFDRCSMLETQVFESTFDWFYWKYVTNAP